MSDPLPPPTDPRIRRTRRLLNDAVLSLAEERDLADITISDITERAEINRATFYLHYRDKDDLVTQALDSLFAEFTAEDRAFLDTHGRLSADVVPPPLIALFEHLNERPRLYGRLLAGTGASAFGVRLRLFEEHQILLLWKEMGLQIAPGSPPIELRARFATTALQGAVAWWLDNDRPESPHQMATWLWDLLAPFWFEMVTHSPRAGGNHRSV